MGLDKNTALLHLVKERKCKKTETSEDIDNNNIKKGMYQRGIQTFDFEKVVFAVVSISKYNSNKIQRNKLAFDLKRKIKPVTAPVGQFCFERGDHSLSMKVNFSQ